MGFYTRQQQEHCLVATNGKAKELVFDRSVRQNIRAINEKHSKKPVETYSKIEQITGECNKLELFARNQFENWDCWGNEI